MALNPSLLELLGERRPFVVLAELVQASFDDSASSVDDALELLQFTEYIHAELCARFGDELHALLLGDTDPMSPIPF